MPERSRKKRPTDINEPAKAIVQEATGEAAESGENPAPERNPHAVALGILGGKKGGPARAVRLTPVQRREIGKKAGRARRTKRQQVRAIA